MKPGLETAIRELLADFDENGQLVGYPVDTLRHVRALQSAFNIETGNSKTVDIPVTDGEPPIGPDSSWSRSKAPLNPTPRMMRDGDK
jgi:hypothetical protein